MRNTFILYLTPETLFKDERILEMQWEVIKTLIPCMLKGLYEGKMEVKLHEFDKISTGLKNTFGLSSDDTLAKVSTSWYYFTKIFHQSLGPRIGAFAERLIRHWIDNANHYSVGDNVNKKLKNVLHDKFGIKKNYDNKIDFVAESKDGKTIAFIELRMSEHTGGKTGQESLLDKFNRILDLLIEDGEGSLYVASMNKGVNRIVLTIAILFSEETHELLNGEKYNRGRLSSLISYIMDENHIWGRLNRLFKAGYKLDEVNVEKETNVNKDSIEKLRESIEKKLREDRAFCIAKTRDKDTLKVEFKILFGDEFFKFFTDKSFIDLIKDCDVVADDIWLFYALALNDFKVAQIHGKTNVRKIYELIKTSDITNDFRDKYTEYAKKDKTQLQNYIKELNQIINGCAQKTLQLCQEKGIELRLLETNDLVKQHNYLKYVCAASFALYLAMDMGKDPNFSKCNWIGGN